MSTYCICMGCNSTSAFTLIWSFPNDETLKRMWMQELGICAIIPGYGVCSNHFFGSEIILQDNVVKLKDGAVPKRFAVNNTENVDPQTESNFIDGK